MLSLYKEIEGTIHDFYQKKQAGEKAVIWNHHGSFSSTQDQWQIQGRSDPRVPQIPPFSLAIAALLYSYQLAIYQFCNLIQ